MLAARKPYTVSAVDRLAPDVIELSLRPEGKHISYSAGRGEEHPYTISSAPQNDVLRLGIKDLGDATHALQDVTLGTRVWVEGPYGDFYARNFPDRGQLWLGGGIGITPFVGAARELQRVGQAPPGGVHVVYLANDPSRAYYSGPLREAARETDGLEATDHYFERDGTISAEFLAQHCPDFASREAYICGPPGMLAHLRRLLRAQGVPSWRIHSEEFNFL